MRVRRILIAGLLAAMHLSAPNGIVQASEVITPPKILYQDQSGLKLRATKAIWSSPVRTTFQWFVNGKAVKGANKLTFTATKSQRAQSIYFKEIVSGNPQRSTSSLVARVGQIIIDRAPVIDFKDSLNKSLIVSLGTASPKNAKVSLQWFRGPIEISSAKALDYLITTSDQGTQLSLSAVYSAKGFSEVTSSSNIIEIPLMKREYQMIWEENFDLAAGLEPDATVWSADIGDGTKDAAGGGWGNRERQYYIASQARASGNSELVIEANRDGASQYSCYYRGPCEWISAKYITKGKLEFKYGRIEARIKGPVGLGTWGAFWMLGNDIDERRWPWCGEIDVTELVGKDPNIAYGYLHGLISGGAGGRGTKVDMPKGFADDYHVYSIDWLPDQINWYVDGVLFGSQAKIDKDWVFDHPFYLIINLAMGGNLGGSIDPNLNKATMTFDWIRFSTINGIGEMFRR